MGSKQRYKIKGELNCKMHNPEDNIVRMPNADFTLTAEGCGIKKQTAHKSLVREKADPRTLYKVSYSKQQIVNNKLLLYA